jgi:hypothetical protein
MGDRSDERLPEELAEVGELLRESRTRPSALELDGIKLHAKARARKRQGSPQLRRGVNVRSRSVTLVLTLLLLGGTTAGGMAWGGGGDDNGDGAAHEQYKTPKCTKDMRKCECPKGYSLTVKDNAIVCQKNPPEDCNTDGDNDGDDQCDDHGHHGGDDGDHGGGGHGHHHHHQWRQHHNGHWQWCDGDGHNDHNWHDWNGRNDDW